MKPPEYPAELTKAFWKKKCEEIADALTTSEKSFNEIHWEKPEKAKIAACRSNLLGFKSFASQQLKAQADKKLAQNLKDAIIDATALASMLDEAKKEMAEEEEEYENMAALQAKKEKDTEVCHSNMLKNQAAAEKLAANITSKLKEAAGTAKQPGHLDEAKKMVVEAAQMLAKLEALAKQCDDDTKVWREKWGSGSEGPKINEKLDKEIKAANESCRELLNKEKRDVKTVYEFFAKMKGSGTA